MTGVRFHGAPPHRVAVLHGGPGAPGSASLLAAGLGGKRGVMEPFQAADSVAGQIAELREVLEPAGEPVTIVGSSWGAWLGFLTAARHPGLVRRLILVGAPPFEDGYARDIVARRLRRLPAPEREEAAGLARDLGDPGATDKDAKLARIGVLYTRADSFDPVTVDTGLFGVSFRVHSLVWKEATRLRARGELSAIGRHIACPVVAIHGDRDPHPAEGVEGPLRRVVPDFRFTLLKDCGHFPWIERRARDAFFRRLDEIL